MTRASTCSNTRASTCGNTRASTCITTRASTIEHHTSTCSTTRASTFITTCASRWWPKVWWWHKEEGAIDWILKCHQSSSFRDIIAWIWTYCWIYWQLLMLIFHQTVNDVHPALQEFFFIWGASHPEVILTSIFSIVAIVVVVVGHQSLIIIIDTSEEIQLWRKRYRRPPSFLILDCQPARRGYLSPKSKPSSSRDYHHRHRQFIMSLPSSEPASMGRY